MPRPPPSAETLARRLLATGPRFTDPSPGIDRVEVLLIRAKDELWADAVLTVDERRLTLRVVPPVDAVIDRYVAHWKDGRISEALLDPRPTVTAGHLYTLTANLDS